jgi:hypothetical protein
MWQFTFYENKCHINCQAIIYILATDLRNITWIVPSVCKYDKYRVDYHMTVYVLVTNVISIR